MARANAVRAIEELKAFSVLDDDLEYAKAQDRPAYVWWLDKAHELVDGRPADPKRHLQAKPGLADISDLLAEFTDEGMNPDFGEQRWWSEQLTELKKGLLELSRQVAAMEHSVATPEAKSRWAEAIASIASSPMYDGLTTTPQLELLPIGLDPFSQLWEFAHLPTGEPAVRDESGILVLRPETGLVFVLIPGGRFWMGEQGFDPSKPNYDSAVMQDQPPHEVTLTRFSGHGVR